MQNGTMMQYFHWYYPADGSLWNKVKDEAPKLAFLGIDAVWLPPAFKGTKGEHSIGYDVYDLYDLGEFDSKGGIFNHPAFGDSKVPVANSSCDSEHRADRFTVQSIVI